MPLKKGVPKNIFFDNTFNPHPVSIHLSSSKKDLTLFATFDEATFRKLSWRLTLIPPTRKIAELEKNLSKDYKPNVSLA